jgi:hypothetical protein
MYPGHGPDRLMVMPWNRSLRIGFFRVRWLQSPTLALLAFLQRAPVTRIAAYLGDAFTGTGTVSAATALVRSASALAALGAIDTLAGATVVVASPASPLSVTTGTPISGAAFGLNGSTIQAESWVLKSTLPPGLTLSGTESGSLTGPGTVAGGNAMLQGTPTTGGTYYLDLVAYEYPGATGASTPDFLYTVNVSGSTIVPVTISSQPVAQTVVAGSTVVFSIGATSTAALTYQWALNGVAILNATLPRLVVTNPTTVGTSTYTVTVSNSAGGAASASTTLTVVAPTSTTGDNPGRLINESVLTLVPAGGSLTVGFISSAAGQRLLIRGVGPSLASLGVTGYVADPAIKVFPSTSTTTPSATDDNWGSDAANIMAADSATGAFPLLSGSLDAALINTPAVPSNSVQFTPNTTGGLGLAEIYDYPTGIYNPSTSPRIINLSTLFLVPAGTTLSAGFVVSGATSKTFLIRAMGPTLGKAYGFTNAMADPALSLVNQQTGVGITANTNWGGDTQIAAVANQVTGFPFATPALADSAVLVSLPPGQYTAEATSASGASGLVLIEIYEVP